MTTLLQPVHTRTHFAPSPAALAPLGAVLIWSGNTLVTKAAATAFHPAAIAFYRWSLAFLVLAPFVGGGVWRQRAVVRANAHRLALLGTLGMAAYQGLAYVAAHSTTALNMGVMLALMPLLSALLASALAGEGLSRWRVAGALVSLAGLVILLTHAQPMLLLQGGAHVGDAWMLLAVLSSALYGVLFKRWHMALTTWQQLLVQIGFGCLVLLPFWMLAPPSPIHLANAPLILYAGIPASIGAPWLWMTGVKALGAARATLFMNLLPPLVAVLAWLLLGEAIHPYAVVGGALALLGVAVGMRKPRQA